MPYKGERNIILFNDKMQIPSPKLNLSSSVLPVAINFPAEDTECKSEIIYHLPLLAADHRNKCFNSPPHCKEIIKKGSYVLGFAGYIGIDVCENDSNY